MAKYYELIKIFPNGKKETVKIFTSFKEADRVAKARLKVSKDEIYHVRVYFIMRSRDLLVDEIVYYNLKR